MGDYVCLLIAGLLLATVLNASELRAVLLTFATFFFLVILRFLPSVSLLESGSWFIAPIIFEIIFICWAVAIGARQSLFVILASCWNLTGHIIGYFAFQFDWAIYSLYGDTIRAGEIGQVLALILFSRPVVNFAVFRQLRKWGRQHGGWERLGIWAN